MDQSPLEMLIVTQLARGFLPFMEHEYLLQCSHKPATGPYPEPDESTLHLPPYFPEMHSNIILLYTPKSSEYSLPFSFSDKILYAFLISPMRATVLVNHILQDLIALIIFG